MDLSIFENFENFKVCSRCKISKNVNDFYKSNQTNDGFRSWCKDCQKKDNNKREPNYSETRKRYRIQNQEEYKTIKKQYYDNNKEKILAINKEYRNTLTYKYLSYKNNARIRKIDFSLTKDEFKSFWQLNCTYCNGSISTIGLDRIENSIGYIFSNITACCENCNRMKSDMSYNDFIQHIKKIYDKNNQGRFDRINN